MRRIAVWALLLLGCPQPEPTAERGHRVSGTFQVAPGSDVDGDLNDPRAPLRPNDTPGAAQGLASPSLVGGFVTAVPTGGFGERFATATDPDDYYRVSLIGGQGVTLDHADPDADLDLFLYRADDPETLVGSSLGGGSTEVVAVSVDAPAEDYLVQVRAVQGTSAYLLTVGERAGTGTQSLGDPVVEGQIVARLSGRPALDRLQALGLRHRAGTADDLVLLDLGDAPDRTLDALDVPPEVREIPVRSARQRERYRTLVAAKALRGRAGVLSADPNALLQTQRVPEDTHYLAQWHYPAIRLPEAWQVTTGQPEAVVAVLDSGVVAAHPDLAANVRADGYDFVSDADRAGDGDGIDPDPDDPGRPGSPGGGRFHGTHVAGTVAAVSDNGLGVAGVGWDVGILPVRVCAVDGCTLFDILQGALYAAGLPNTSLQVPRRPADVINLSLGGSGFSETAQGTWTQIRQSGVVVVAAAGNRGVTDPFYPAAYEAVISVGAVDLGLDRALYSNFGETVDVVAPGGDIASDQNRDGYPDGVLSTLVEDTGGERAYTYGFYQGTSMAAPHVSGVVALMLSLDPDLGPDGVEALLASGALTTDLGEPGRDDVYGHGLIDGLSAVEATLRAMDEGLPPVPTVSPHRVQIGLGDSALFTIANLGGGALEVEEVVAEDPWLQARAVRPSADGTGTWRVDVDRAPDGEPLPDGYYTGNVRVETDAGTALLQVAIQVGLPSAGRTVGLAYAVLLDEDMGTVAGITLVRSEEGVYTFGFEDVPDGRYLLFAGTDVDADNRLCGPAEACGAWPVLADPEAIEVRGGDVEGLVFDVAWQLELEAAAR